MNGSNLLDKAMDFNSKLEEVKNKIDSSFPWYPYGILNNFIHLRDIFNKYPLDSPVKDSPKILDIGAADSDLSFFLESLGYNPDIIDYGPTNFNNLEGVRLLKREINSQVEIYEFDIDSQFKIPNVHYELTFLLGILYHLKNPFFILEFLSLHSKYMLISTRIAKFTPDGTNIFKYPLAYLLAPDESNNDATNYWIFTDTSLRRLFSRSGWEIIEMISVGDKKNSNPSDHNHDERAFALLKSIHNK
jgi:hypothetical protein